MPTPTYEEYIKNPLLIPDEKALSTILHDMHTSGEDPNDIRSVFNYYEGQFVAKNSPKKSTYIETQLTDF